MSLRQRLSAIKVKLELELLGLSLDRSLVGWLGQEHGLKIVDNKPGKMFVPDPFPHGKCSQLFVVARGTTFQSSQGF